MTESESKKIIPKNMPNPNPNFHQNNLPLSDLKGVRARRTSKGNYRWIATVWLGSTTRTRRHIGTYESPEHAHVAHVVATMVVSPYSDWESMYNTLLESLEPDSPDWGHSCRLDLQSTLVKYQKSGDLKIYDHKLKEPLTARLTSYGIAEKVQKAFSYLHLGPDHVNTLYIRKLG